MSWPNDFPKRKLNWMPGFTRRRQPVGPIRQIKEKYGSGSILKGSRVVFNICGNKYRLVVKINYAYAVVYVRFAGTHREYDRVNAEEI